MIAKFRHLYEAELLTFKVADHQYSIYSPLPFYPHPCLTFVLPLNISLAASMSSTAMGSLRQIRRLPTPLIDSISYRSTRSFAQSCRMRATVGLDALDASKADRERVIILGSGWAGKADSWPRGSPYIDMTLRLRPLPTSLCQIPNLGHIAPLLLCLHSPPQFHGNWNPRISNGP